MRYSDASLRSRDAIPSQTLISSHALAWRSLLLNYHRDGPSREPFRTGATPDQTITVMVEGVQEIESLCAGRWRRSTYRCGTVGLTPPGQTDQLRRQSCPGAPPSRKISLYIPADVFREAAAGARGDGGAVLNALAFEDPLLTQMALGLLRAAHAEASELYADTAAHWIAAHLVARHSPWRSDPVERDQGERVPNRRLRAAISYMEAHLAEPLSLEDLAAVAGVSKFHFARIFRDGTGVPPHTFLLRLRLRHGRRLLAVSDEPVAQIARSCGFRTAAHFTARFGREYGVTPTAYRDR